MNKVLAYLRVSMDRQNLDNQRVEILKYADMRGIEVTHWIEVSMSTRRSEHLRRLNEVQTLLEQGDILIATELSRIGRSLGQVITLMHSLTSRGVTIHVIKNGLVLGANSDLASRIQLAVFALLSEIERDIISERVKMGLAARKEQGIKLGRPLGSGGYRKLKGRERDIVKMLEFGVSKRAISRMMNVSPNTVCNFVKEMDDGSDKLL